MKRKFQKLAIMALSGAMIVGSIGAENVPGFSAIVANAEEAIETLIDIDFENGTLNDFMAYMEGGDCDLANVDGALQVNIHNCGEVNYANQIYLEGFELREGCKYKFSFDVHSSIKRKIGYRIQLNGGDYHAYDSKRVESATEARHIESLFTMNKASDPAPRLCFNMGLQSDMKEDPGEHQVYIDNIQLTLVDDSKAIDVKTEAEASEISINQVGYLPEEAKVLVASGEYEGQEFAVKNSETGENVYTGTLGEAFSDKSTKQNICHGDFSELTQEGTYLISIGEAVESPAFTIGDSVYDDLFRDTFKMLYLQRCGEELPEELAGAYAHPACHTAEATIYGTNEKKDVSGGWHDAGDYGRYTVTAAKTAADLLLAYEANPTDPLIASDDLGIAESGNGIPDILDEVKFELDWLLKMQDDAAGGVYHKVSCYYFPGTVMPQNENAELVLAPIAATSTADFAAIMAKAAVDYAEVDAEVSENYLNAAMKAWAFLEENKNMKGFTNPPEISTGEYGDGSAKDEIYWAAVELYLAGQKLGKETISVDQIPNTKVNPELGWTEMGAYGLFDLAKANVPEEAQALAEAAKKRLIDQADYFCKMSESDGYFVSIGENYWWGSNMGVANNGMLLLMANALEQKETYPLTAKKQLDYLLGVNGKHFSYVSGFGTNAMADPHHRPSQSVGKAVPGMLAGGPNKGLDDPYAKQALKGVAAPALCYVDNQQSYSTNEVAIYWNSPLVNLIAGIK